MKNSIPQLFIIFFGLLFLSISCNNDEIECTTPPAPIVFEFVDTEGNNLIGNGELNINQIKIKEITSDSSKKRKTLLEERKILKKKLEEIEESLGE